MSLYLHSINALHESKLATLPQADPAFRKATTNMIAAHAVCQKTLTSSAITAERKKLPVLLATHFGEVNSTLEYLTTLHETKVTKPILFQNSLHNSTLGFVSIALSLTGPAFTISADSKMDSAVFNLAETLTELSPDVLVCYVDIVPDYLKEAYLSTFPQLENNFGWARSFILSKNKPANCTVYELTADSFSYANLVGKDQ